MARDAVPWPRDLLELPVDRAARLVALDFLRAAIAAAERLPDRRDHDALHDFRVAIRRLRSWLRAYEPVLHDCVSRKSLRRLGLLARATGRVRDLDVQLAGLSAAAREIGVHRRSDIVRLRARLERKRRTVDRVLQAAVTHRFGHVAARLRRELANETPRMHSNGRRMPQSMAAAAADALRDASARFRRRLDEIAAANDPRAIHRARIAAKRLRYLIEPVAGAHSEHAGVPLGQLARLQDMIGNILDVRLLLREVAAEAETATPASGRHHGLAAIAARLRRRDAEGVAWVERSWCGANATTFFATIDSLVEVLAWYGSRSWEIERKFLLRALPRRAGRAHPRGIEQGYIPGDHLVERLRRVRSDEGVQLLRTIKLGSGMARVEIEEETTAHIFDAMWPLTRGRRIRKRRYAIPHGPLVWEIDEFLDRELVLAEIELPTEDTAVKPPAWLAPYVVREVTGDPLYLNVSLAMQRRASKPKPRMAGRRARRAADGGP
jgi:CHAD domain-containing protein/CYTH domain-containing protein